MRHPNRHALLAVTAVIATLGCLKSPTESDDEFLPITALDGTTRLASEILTPVGDGPYPAIVIVPGTEMNVRQAFVSESQYHVLLGFASARYDNRGVGQSTGEFVETTPENSEEVFDVLADDVIAVVNYLKTRPEIDANNIGLLGGSEAGWIIALAASRSADVKFTVSVSGAASTVGLTEYYASISTELSEEEIAEALANFSGTHGFDPAPLLESHDVPGLWVYGGQDKVNPTVNDMAILQQIDTDFDQDFTICLFPRANHSLQNVVDGEPLAIRPECVTPWLQDRRD